MKSLLAEYIWTGNFGQGYHINVVQNNKDLTLNIGMCIDGVAGQLYYNAHLKTDKDDLKILIDSLTRAHNALK